MFSGILPADYQGIAAAARSKQFARGEILYRHGDSEEHVTLLTSGFVKITQLGMRGDQVFLRFRVPGDVLGADALYSTESRII